MAGERTWLIDQGSHFHMSIGWGIREDDGSMTAYDLDGATPFFTIGGYAVPDTYGIAIEDNRIIIDIDGADTALIRTPTTYVIGVTMASGVIHHVLEGKVLGRHAQ